MDKNTNNTSRFQTTLTLARTRVLPVVVSNFRNKLIGVVLAGLVLPQMAYAGSHGGAHGGGGHSGGHRSGGSSVARSMHRPSSPMKSFSQRSSNFQHGGQKQLSKQTFSHPSTVKNGHTGGSGSGLHGQVTHVHHGNTGITGGGKLTATQHTIDQHGSHTGGAHGGGTGHSHGGSTHGHGHGVPWWAFVTPVVGYPSYPGYNSGYSEPVYQQPVYNNAPVYSNAPVVDQAPATPANYTAPAPAATPSQPIDGQPVNANSDGYVDLVLEDVEYLEPATVTVGPLYLVKVRNQGTKLSEKFRIGAFAQLEGELSDDAPRSVTEVANLGAGELASVTLRLPAAAMKLINTSSAGSAVFNQLLVVVDLDDSVDEIEKSNNVANLDRAALEAAAAH